MGIRGVIFGVWISFYFVNYVQGQVISGNILQILQRTTGFSKFAQLVTRAQLTKFYESPTTMTVFAFNDTAYNQLPYRERNVIDSYNVTELKDYIKFCTIPGNRIATTFIQNNQYVRSSSSNGDRLFFSRVQRIDTTAGLTYALKYYVNGVEISDGSYRDISATNGVVHGLNGVMRKTSQKTTYGWIQNPEDTAQQFTRFLDLMSYLYVMDPINDISSPDKIITLFVPSDNAMQKIPTTQLDRLKNDSKELQRIIQAHYVPNQAIFTNCISHNEGVTNANGETLTFLQPFGYNVYVNSGGVSADITEGNVTVTNGVVHVVDQLLGFVYNNIREQIQREGTKFEQLINRGTETVRNALLQPSGITVFLPLDSAFQKFSNIPWVNLTSNQTLVDMVLRLHILQPKSAIISSLSEMSGYESRQYRKTMYNSERVTIYNERNETWVQGSDVKARVIGPDIQTINGWIHIIDSVLGIPYLDLPMLICHDVWLLRTYDYMRRVGLKNYLTDRRFTAEKCSFELYGYPPNYRSAMFTNQGPTCPTYCSQAEYKNQYPCNTAQCQTNTGWSTTCPTYCAQVNYQNQYPCNTAICTNSNIGGVTTCPTYCSQSQYANQYPCNSAICTSGFNCPAYCSQPQYANSQQCLTCDGGSISQCQYMIYCSDPSNANKSPCNTYPCNMLNGTSDYDMGCCGTTSVACEFTVFVPNSSAIDYFSLSLNGIRVMRDTPRFQYLFKRLIVPGRIYLEKLGNGNHQIKVLNGETISLTKTNDREVRIYFGGASANVIHMDEGATNGVIHIIDQLLFVQEDLTRNIKTPSEVVVEEEKMRKGFCYNDTQKLGIHINCHFNSTRVVIEEDSSDTKNCQNSHNSQKERVTCVVGGYDETYNMLEFILTSNDSEHAGKSILVNTTCENGTDQSKNITLYPCFSCFTANVRQNGTHAFFMCKHSFFNVSKQISIIDTADGVPMETCRWNDSTSTTECNIQNHGHPLGIDGFIAKYTPGRVFLCSMDRQSTEMILEGGSLTSGQEGQYVCCGVDTVIYVTLIWSIFKSFRFIY
ncbi:uncharacterized protein LOC133198963 [Saccostrea echinata]|uniref:uncharacterized protein LOC133198963 n=1 Tax=Saccostrea echinata TaxID=191078 RepID=UPI002A7ECF21|nr:uncharacterized protein LOC133198963 [Saccostrea echinata]